MSFLLSLLPKHIVSGNDADAAAFFTASGVTDPTQQAAVNSLVTGLKADGLWSLMVALYPFVGGTATKHSFNLVAPAQHAITWSGSNTSDATGVSTTSSGTGSCATLASNLCSANSIAFGVYVQTNPGESLSKIVTTDNLFHINTHHTNTNFYARNPLGAGEIVVPVDSTPGLFVSTRTVAGHEAYRNTTLLGSSVTASTGTSSAVFEFAQSNVTMSLAFLSAGLSAAQAAAFYARVQAYQTALGRQV